MEIRFMRDKSIQIDDARIIFRNFSGRGDRYNRAGERNFCVVIPDESIAEKLMDAGWNVRIKPPKIEGDEPYMFMKVKVRFGDYGPDCYLASGRSQVKLTEATVGCLDKVQIMSVDMDIRPYDWDRDGQSGRTAYLNAIRVTQRLDRFAELDKDEDDPF